MFLAVLGPPSPACWAQPTPSSYLLDLQVSEACKDAATHSFNIHEMSLPSAASSVKRGSRQQQSVVTARTCRQQQTLQGTGLQQVQPDGESSLM